MITIISDINLKGFDQHNFIHVNEHAKSCTGCFSCWIKTPGACIFDDTINESIIKSQTLVIISKNTFGSYSSKIKSVLDKSIPLVLPTFTTIKEETHHKKRYDTYPNIHSIVYDSISQRSLETYKTMVHAHGLNLHAGKVSIEAVDQSQLAHSLQVFLGGQDV